MLIFVFDFVILCRSRITFGLFINQGGMDTVWQLTICSRSILISWIRLLMRSPKGGIAFGLFVKLWVNLLLKVCLKAGFGLYAYNCSKFSSQFLPSKVQRRFIGL